MQLWRPELELVGISSGSCCHCLPTGRVFDYERKVVQYRGAHTERSVQQWQCGLS